MNDKKLKLDKHPRPLEPSLWIMALRATGNGAVELYHMHTVQYTKLEAIEATLKKLREQA